MRNLKKALSLTLALALSLSLAVPAFAAPVKLEGEYESIEFSDVISQETVSGLTSPFFPPVDIPLITVKVGTTFTATSMAFYKASYEDGVYTAHFMDSYDFRWLNQEPNHPITLADEDIGLWYYPSYCYMNVIAADGSAPSTPDITVENIPASGTAKASTQAVEVDGKKVEFQMYALLDANGNSTNYIKLRDMAHVLNGTKAQFSIGYSKEAGITATTGQPYADNGSEMKTPFSGDRAYTGGGQSVQINGKAVELTAINLLDDQGGGYNYFKLRDLGAALGFNVGWTAQRGVYVETDKPYVG